jgi:hypothetical protein
MADNYNGTATCKVKLPSGDTRDVSCSIAGIYNTEFDAKSALQVKLEGAVSASSGTKVDGSVSLSVSISGN